MSISLRITLNLQIDPDTGDAYCCYKLCGGKPMKKVLYNPDMLRIPEKFRRFVNMNGPYLYHYINEVSEDTYYCSANNMLMNYPSWSSFTGSLVGWTEADHYAFEEALEWFSSKECFLLTWCY